MQSLMVITSKKHAKSHELPVYFKLNTPENIVAFNAMRNFFKVCFTRV